MEHYPSLFIAYITAVAIWFAISLCWPKLWEGGDAPKFEKPWFEVGWAFVAAVGVILVGQLYQRDIRFPTDNLIGPIFESLNQLAIFSPILIMMAIRRQPLSSAWLRTDKLHIRIPIGIVIAMAAIAVYSLVREGAHPFWTIIWNTYAYDNLGLAAQVLLEDIAIAVLAVRLSQAIGVGRTIILVAFLFAAGHIPAMVAEGVSLHEFADLLLDTLLGVTVLGAIMRSKDIWWFWCVHFAMDMMQFERISGVAG